MKKAITEIRGQDTVELHGKLQDLRKEQFKLRFRGSDEGASMTTRNRDIRRTIARIKTVMGERTRTEVAATVGSTPAGQKRGKN